MEVYYHLLGRYGPQHWWPAETPWEMILGAILTQSVAWSNVERALANLRSAVALEPAALHDLPEEELAALIRPSGYYNAKARKIKAFVTHLAEGYGYDLNRFLQSKSIADLRAELLGIHGVGPETADSIILYAAHQPIFVIDAYTRRLFPRLGLVAEGIDYADLQAFFHHHLAPDTPLYQEYHALIVRHSHTTCLKKPLCSGCPLLATCPFGQIRHPTS